MKAKKKQTANRVASKKLLGSTVLSRSQLNKLNDWCMKLNCWEVPKEFSSVRASDYRDGRDHIRVMHDFSECIEAAFKKPNPKVSRDAG